MKSTHIYSTIIVLLGFILQGCKDTGLLDEPAVQIEPYLRAFPQALTMTVGAEQTIDLNNLVKAVDIASWTLTEVQDSDGLGTINNQTATGFDYLANTAGVTILPYEVKGGGKTASSDILIAINPKKSDVTNTKPTAEAISLTTSSDKNISVNLRQYINDVDGDALTIIKVVAPSGRFSLGSDGFTLTFSPQGFVGVDQATYVVSDGHDGYAIAYVVVTSNDDNPMPPNIAPIAKNYTKNIDSQTLPVWNIDLIVLGLISDADDDPLKLVRIFDGNGRATINGDTKIVYTPGTFTGVDQFTYVINDDKQGFAAGTFTITVSHPTPGNEIPVATPVIVRNVMDDDTQVTVISVVGAVSDPDGDALRIVSVLGADGLVTIDTTNPLVVDYLPNGAVKQDTFVYAITDGKGGFAQSTITVELISQNVIPPIAKIVSETTLDNQTLTINLNDFISDAEIDNAGLTVSNLSSATLPAVATLFSGKQLQYVPNGFVGVDILTYTLSDGELITTGTVVISVNHDDGHVLTAQDFSVTVQPGSTGNTLDWLSKVSSDALGDTYTLLRVSEPTLGSVTTDNWVLKYTPTVGKFGEDKFVYTVEDSQEPPHFAHGIISITIEQPPLPTIMTLTVTGEPSLGSVLTSQITCTSCDPAKNQYQWVINGLTAGTASTYTFTTADLGHHLRLEVVGTDIYGQSVAEYVVYKISLVKSITTTRSAFAALRDDGAVVAWGVPTSGGDSSAVSDKLTSGVKTIFRTDFAFAALKDDGSVVSWGSANLGGDSSAVASSLISGVKTVYESSVSFSALKKDGSVVMWGVGTAPVIGSLTIKSVTSTASAFAALTDSGAVVTWGVADSEIDNSSVAASLSAGVIRVFASRGAFAALKDDGTVITWGHIDFGGNSSVTNINSTATTQPLTSVSTIFSNHQAFAALNDDSSLLTWGNTSTGGDSSAVAGQLTSGINTVFSNPSAMAALKINGSIVVWGESRYGGDSSAVASSLTSGVKSVFATSFAFAALKEDGSVVTWGFADNGGDSSAVSAVLSSGVQTIFATSAAFAALKDDGSVVTWGLDIYGGDSTAVASRLSSEVSIILPTDFGFAAIKSDGTVVVWGRGFSADAGFEPESLEPIILLIESSL